MSDLGTDFDFYKANEDGELDLDPYFGVISGPAVVSQALARRFEIARKDLDWDPEAGYDLRRWLNADIDSSAVLAIQNGVQGECLKDERVLSVDVTVAFTGAQLTISVAGQTASGDFKLVLVATQLSVQAITIS